MHDEEQQQTSSPLPQTAEETMVSTGIGFVFLVTAYVCCALFAFGDCVVDMVDVYIWFPPRHMRCSST